MTPTEQPVTLQQVAPWIIAAIIILCMLLTAAWQIHQSHIQHAAFKQHRDSILEFIRERERRTGELLLFASQRSISEEELERILHMLIREEIVSDRYDPTMYHASRRMGRRNRAYLIYSYCARDVNDLYGAT